MMTLWDWILYQIQHNQFASAALIAGPTAAVSFAARSLPLHMWHGISRLSTINVTFTNDRTVFQDAVDFLTHKVIKERFTRDYTATSAGTESPYIMYDHEEGHTTKNQSSPPSVGIGYGNHIGIYRGRLVFINRTTEQSQSKEVKEYCTCRFLSRSRTIIEQFMTDISAYALETKKADNDIKMKTNQGPR